MGRFNLISRIQVVEGDITRMDVDAIVNAANTTLLGGGGVDGAIHRAAGPGLREECRAFGGCPTGDARITGGQRLKAKHVIHTVGPIWKGGRRGEARLLASCYRNSLSLAREHGLPRVGFTAVSTGAYRFPLARAAQIAVREVASFLEKNELPREVILVCFSVELKGIYEVEVGKLRAAG